MNRLRIACTAIAKRIQLGRVNKTGDSFIGDPVDVTSDCLVAVMDFIGRGETKVVTENGQPAYEITVRDVRITSTVSSAPAAADEVRDAVARAIWNIRREDEDRCDMELEDMGDSHSVWAEADAAIRALRTKRSTGADGSKAGA